jgi:CheY-like chemotaxis protein
MDDSASPAARHRILVVDDTAPMRQVAAIMLRSLGHTVLEAENAKAALDLLQGQAPVDLVLMDIVMPGGMSGIELAGELRRRGLARQILFTSGFANPALAGTVEWGEESFLPKPYRKADLAKRLEILLGA